MIAKQFGKYRVLLFNNSADVEKESPVAMIHVDEFYDLFGEEIAELVKFKTVVEISVRTKP